MAPKKAEQAASAQKPSKSRRGVSKSRSNTTSNAQHASASTGRQTRAMVAKARAAGEQVDFFDRLETSKRRRAGPAAANKVATPETSENAVQESPVPDHGGSSNKNKSPSNAPATSHAKLAMPSTTPSELPQPETASRTSPEPPPPAPAPAPGDTPGLAADPPNHVATSTPHGVTGEPSANATEAQQHGRGDDPYLWTGVVSDIEKEQARWRDWEIFGDGQEFLRHQHFPNLGDYIGHLVGATFPWKCNWQKLDSAVKAKLLAVCPKAHVYVEKKRHREAREFFYAYIWRVLYENLFSPQCSDKWAGEAWASFGVIYRSLARRVVNRDNPFTIGFHTSRADTYRMLFMLHGPHTYPDRLCNILLDTIRPFMQDHLHEGDEQLDSDEEPLTDSESNSSDSPDAPHPSGPPTRPASYRKYRSFLDPQMREDVRKICQVAVKMDAIMLSSPLNIKMDIDDPATGQAHGFPFTGTLMKQYTFGVPRPHKRDAVEGKSVDYVLSPALRMWGRDWGAAGFYELNGVKFRTTRWLGSLEWQIPMVAVVDQFPERSVYQERDEGSLQ